MRGMKQDRKIRVNVEKLVTKMKENRETHIKDHAEAVIEYRAACVKVLYKTLRQARQCEKEALGFVDLTDVFKLSKPSSFEKAYTEVLTMLEFQEDTEIELEPSEFSKWVLDEWSWKGQFEADKLATSQYLGG
jgi:hypothetical protein